LSIRLLIAGDRFTQPGANPAIRSSQRLLRKNVQRHGWPSVL
jgi:hypothetical protein